MRLFDRTRKRSCSLMVSGVRQSRHRASIIRRCIGYNLGDWADEIEAIRLCAL